MINNKIVSNVNYQLIACEILRVIRGKTSQRTFSNKLGYSFNQVGKWESGVTQIKWDDFLKIANFKNLAIEDAFSKLFFLSLNEQKFSARSSILVLEKSIVLSKNKDFSEARLVKKWIRGDSIPHFSSVLNALDLMPSMLMGFLSFFIDCSKIPSLQKHYQEFMLRLDFVLNDPVCVYVNAALQLRSYQNLKIHSDQFIAEHAACSIKHAKKLVLQMNKHEIIKWDGTKYLPCPFDFSFSALPLVKLRSLTKFTTQFAADLYPLIPYKSDIIKAPNTSISSVRVVAMSQSASRKIRELISTFHHEVSIIVKEDRLPKDNVQVMLIHSFASNIKHSGK